MNVVELMTQPVKTCSTRDTLERAVQIMWENDCGAVPVVDDEGHTVGVVTDRDASIAAYTQGKALSEIPVAVAASRTLVSVQPEDTIALARVLMEAARIRRLPVLDGARRPLGFISLSDIARLAATEQDAISGDAIARTLATISQPLTAPNPSRHEPVYRVRYRSGAWEIFDREERSASGRIEALSNAVAHAKELARRDGSAQILVYDTRGNLTSEFFYQREERTALASDDSAATLSASHSAHVRRLPI